LTVPKSTTAAPKYTSHPITAFFPMMKPKEYAELKADIQANGQQVPIVVLGNQIIDGRHREQACRELGIPVKTIDASGDPFLLVQSLNLRRRHLTADQIAAFHQRIRREHPELGKKVEAIRQQAQERQRGALKQGTAVPRRLPGKPTGKTGRTSALVAAEIGSTKTAVEHVDRVACEHPEALPAIEAGTITAKQVLRHGGTKTAPKRPAEPRPGAIEAFIAKLGEDLAARVQKSWTVAASLEVKKKIVARIEDLLRDWQRQLNREPTRVEAAAAKETTR
jgi:hypothetical protein